MKNKKTILMVAAENDALPDAKVGGIGDVVRDLPWALAEQGCVVHSVLPSYGYLHQLPGASLAARFPVQFGEGMEQVSLYQVPLSATKFATTPDADESPVCYWVLHHPGMHPCGVKQVYCNDGSDRPFATDANKYALFCAAVGQAILSHSFGDLDVLHLHDWHAALLLVLREYDPHYAPLKSIHTVYTIHNLSLQGVRPLHGDASSLRAWFPYLSFDRAMICDPSASSCINPMRAAVQLADKVHAVSPTYAREIQEPSYPDLYIYGGEGLEVDLLAAAKQGRLVGILNGCDYSETPVSGKLVKSRLVRLIRETLVTWVSRSTTLASVHWLAEHRLQAWAGKKERGFIVTSVGRVTEQKARLLRESIDYGRVRQPVLAHLLECLGDQGTFIMLGSGDAEYEQFFTELSGTYDNFIFLKGYSDFLAQALYRFGDLFLMPSSFEPCGISQMLAMRAGQPCLVHSVGGLNDTVIDGVSGFGFSGGDGKVQGYNLLKRFEDVLTLAKLDPKKLQTISKAAAKARFSWRSVAEEYLASLY